MLSIIKNLHFCSTHEIWDSLVSPACDTYRTMERYIVFVPRITHKSAIESIIIIHLQVAHNCVCMNIRIHAL